MVRRLAVSEDHFIDAAAHLKFDLCRVRRHSMTCPASPNSLSLKAKISMRY
jgi:hypothetical protein